MGHADVRGQPRRLAVVRQKDEAASDGIGRGYRSEGSPLQTEFSSRTVWPGTEDGRERLARPGALQAGDSHHLAGPYLQGHALDHVAVLNAVVGNAQITDLEQGWAG